MRTASTGEERVLIFAPRGRDAEVMCSVLAGDGVGCGTAACFEALVDQIEAGSGAAIVA
ncbi:MAG TPA: hybrid sensor histidine kinase/response regulator, partial [Massilia sp.]|nr:hybrid sensor histidine kinase/response regulator [Massilia sp.]